MPPKSAIIEPSRFLNFQGASPGSHVRWWDVDYPRSGGGALIRGDQRHQRWLPVDQWLIEDSDGNAIDPEKDRVPWNEELIFTAARWQLFEASHEAGHCHWAWTPSLLLSLKLAISRITLFDEW